MSSSLNPSRQNSTVDDTASFSLPMTPPPPPPPPLPDVTESEFEDSHDEDSNFDGTIHMIAASTANTICDWRRLQPELNQSDSWYCQHDMETIIHDLRFHLQECRSENSTLPQLLRNEHMKWIKRNLKRIPKGYLVYDALQPWLSFWIVHSLNILRWPLSSEESSLLLSRLRSMQVYENGPFSGGPLQPTPHLASTFAAVMAIASIGTHEALTLLQSSRNNILNFINQMKQPDGSFTVSHGGETDARALYCALSVASLFNCKKQLYENVPSYIKSLQAFDGGLAGEPGAEAHGGNTYCALASAVIVGCVSDCVDVERLKEWIVMRQMSYEGGFQGRANKLVDSCYSFWVGSLFPMLDMTDIMESAGVCQYVLQCCQLPNGGLRDKPGVARDLMHTCYALSGLSVAVHYAGVDFSHDGEDASEMEIEKVDVIYNLTAEKLKLAKIAFNDITI